MARRKLALFVALAVLAVANVPFARAAAPGPRLLPARSISGPSPFEAECSGAVGAAHGSEVEPHVAVNPADPNNVVAAWIQDRFASHGGGQSNVIAYTRNGGTSWRKRPVVGISRCTGGEWQRGTDPWLDIAPDGTIYLATLSMDGQLNVTWRRNALTISRSSDGGETWTDPAVVIDDPAVILNDKEAITVDPTRPGHVYLVWARFVGVSVILYLSKSTDGGDTWAPPLPMATISTGGQGNEILVTPDGTLVDIFYSGGTLYNIRSTDAGMTWTNPQAITAMQAASTRSPDTSRTVRAAGAIPNADIGPDGEIYVTWARTADQLNHSVVVVKSTDNGVTWTEPIVVKEIFGQMFTPSVAVAGDGTVGVTYYDFRNFEQHPGGLDTDVWFSWSPDGGQTWTEEHMAGPFDIDGAPYADGLFLGDYVGLEASEKTFHAIFTMATPNASEQRPMTDIYHAKADFSASSSPPAPRVLGNRKTLPATGAAAAPVLGAVMLIGAAVLRRWHVRGA